MNKYTIKWKKINGFIWYVEKNCIGHKYNFEADEMVVYFSDGGLHRIPRWSLNHMKLGSDWVLYTKTQMEKESGLNIKLNVEPKND